MLWVMALGINLSLVKHHFFSKFQNNIDLLMVNACIRFIKVVSHFGHTLVSDDGHPWSSWWGQARGAFVLLFLINRVVKRVYL